MTMYVFTGPTLSVIEGKAETNAIFLPPAAQGDVYRAAQDKPVAIGIIDGYFERIPSVSHKEILWAMSQGVHVLGAASMGALRAAELSAFGMEGVGVVYEAFAHGQLDSDDEVAVAHALAEDGYRPASEAMVNIRATLCAAEQVGAISAEASERFVRIAKALFYPDRSYPALLAQGAKDGIPTSEIESLKAFLPNGRVHQKRLDALALLAVMRQRFEAGAEPKRVRYHFEPTDAWEQIRANADHRAFARSMRAPDPAIEELKALSSYAAARRGALGRTLALEAARRQNHSPEGAVLSDAIAAFCRVRGLTGAHELQQWLTYQGVTNTERFLRDEALVQWAENLYGSDVDHCLADYLRSTGEYAPLLARAQSKRHGVDDSGGALSALLEAAQSPGPRESPHSGKRDPSSRAQ